MFSRYQQRKEEWIGEKDRRTVKISKVGIQERQEGYVKSKDIILDRNVAGRNCKVRSWSSSNDRK